MDLYSWLIQIFRSQQSQPQIRILTIFHLRVMGLIPTQTIMRNGMFNTLLNSSRGLAWVVIKQTILLQNNIIIVIIILL